jgi:hypothetical protein
MNKKQNILILLAKRLVFYSLPMIAVLYIAYEVILGLDVSFSWMFATVYASIIGMATAINYRNMEITEPIGTFEDLENKIAKGRWEIIEKRDETFVLKPKFDFPYNKLSKDFVEVEFSNGSAKMNGPWYYIDKLSKDIKGKTSILTKRVSGIITTILILSLVSIPILGEAGMFWKIKLMRHNSSIQNVETIHFQDESINGNSGENLANYGYAVENDDYIFYVEDHLNLIRVSKDLKDKTYLIQRQGGNGINRLNLAEDWIFYMSGESLNRMKIDGSEEQTIYKQGYLMDIHLKGNNIYFINPSDKFTIYTMDVNGRGLKRFLDVEASDIAIYGDRLYFSHKTEDYSYIESIALDGTGRWVETGTLARDIIMKDGYFYYIGEDYKLYKAEAGSIEDPQAIIDAKVSSYIIIEDKIFYSIHAEDVGYPGNGVYRNSMDGSENELFYDTKRVEGFARVGDWLIFHSSDNDQLPTLKRIDLESGKVQPFDTIVSDKTLSETSFEFDSIELSRVYDKNSPELNDGLIINDGITVNVNIIVPQIKKLDNADITKEFNEHFEMEGNALLDKAIEYLAIPDLKQDTEVRVDWNYMIERNDKKWLSVVREGVIDLGEVSSQSAYHSDNFYITDEGLEYIYLDSLFTIPSEEFKTIIIKQILSVSNNEFSRDGLEGYFDFNNFYLTDDEIVIFYQEGSISSQDMGIQEFMIPFKELGGIIREDLLN